MAKKKSNIVKRTKRKVKRVEKKARKAIAAYAYIESGGLYRIPDKNIPKSKKSFK